jgi:hypothetical protein
MLVNIYINSLSSYSYLKVHIYAPSIPYKMINNPNTTMTITKSNHSLNLLSSY